MAQDDRAFISYCRIDSEFALRLAGDLKVAGASVWLDQLDIAKGDRWDRSVEDALINCTRMLVILSPASANSTNVMDEVSFALEEGKAVIPVIYRDCKVPFRLRRLQYADFRQDYLRALQDLLATFAPRQRAEQNKSAILEIESQIQRHDSKADEVEDADETRSVENESTELSEQASLDREHKRAEPAPADDNKIGNRVSGRSKVEFCLPWFFKGEVPTKVQDAAVLLTDLSSFTSAGVSRLVELCRDSAKTLIVVAPALASSTARLVNAAGALAVEARNLNGQPMNELLEDLAVYLGGSTILRELGFGLPLRPECEDGPGRYILRGFLQMDDVRLDELGSARVVSGGAYATCFKARHASKYVASKIKQLKYRASHYARSHDEFSGLIERLRRFGADEPVKESLMEPVAFAHDAHELTLPAELASWYFITDNDRYECRIKKPKTLVTTYPLYDGDTILPALEAAGPADEGLVVFAPSIREEALATMVMNKLRGTVRCVAIEVGSSEQLSALAHFTGAKLINKANADQLLGPSIGRLFGDANEVVAEFHKARIKR